MVVNAGNLFKYATLLFTICFSYQWCP